MWARHGEAGVLAITPPTIAIKNPRMTITNWLAPDTTSGLRFTSLTAQHGDGLRAM